MAAEPKILEKIVEDYKASKRRQADAQDRVDALNKDLAAWQSRVDEEVELQHSLDSLLLSLGESPIGGVPVEWDS